MARIDWSAPAEVVARTIRAYDPKPGAFTTHRGGEIKLFGAAAATEQEHGNNAPGTVIADRCTRNADRVRHGHGAGHVRAAGGPHACRSGGMDARPRHRCRRAIRVESRAI